MAPLPKTSKCVFKEIGETGVCYVQDIVAIPALDDYSVLIEVKACALSSIDDKVLKKIFKRWEQANANRYPVGQDIAGTVRAIGEGVTMFKAGDEVVGVIPLDYRQSGCAEYVVLNEFEVTRKPENVTYVDAAGCIGDAVKAYTALHYLGRLSGGDGVLVMDGASSFGSLLVQLAHHWGGKVVATASSEDEKLYLEGLDDQLAAVIDLRNHRNNKTSSKRNSGILLATCMEETGGLGIDLAIDNGAPPPADKKETTINDNHAAHPAAVASKREIIASLGVGARWITSNADLQLDPPDSRVLFMKCASVGFLFEQAWTLSSTHQGRYLHILMDIMEKVSDGIITPNIHHTVPFEATADVMTRLHELRVGKVVAKID